MTADTNSSTRCSTYSDVLIIGGGFARVRAAFAAQKAGMGRLRVALVSRRPETVIRPRLYEADPATLVADISGPLANAGIGFIAADVASVGAGEATLCDGRVLSFARGVLASGSVMTRPPLPGIEHAHSIDDLEDAVRFDDALAQVAALPAATVAVVGAGFTGLELALEMRDRLMRHGGHARAEAARIILIDQRAVGAELGPAVAAIIASALDEAPIERISGRAIARLTDEGLVIADGTFVAADCTVLCTGLAASPLARAVHGAHDALGRIILGPDLRSSGNDSLFVAGDAGVAECSAGRPTFMSCQHALATGPVAGTNAARDLLGEELLEFRADRYVTCLDLGRSGAVFTEGWDRTPTQVGDAAKAIKHRINRKIIYPPTGVSLV